MPSEAQAIEATSEATLADRALEALESRVGAFHSAVASAEEEIRTYVTHHRGASEYRTEQALMELGQFAIGRIDPEKFGLLLGAAEELSDEAEVVLDRAEHILAEYATSMDFHRVAVETGGDLRDVVKDALDHVGQVFGASRAVELARNGLFNPGEHNHFLGHLSFRRWNRAERQLAPPHCRRACGGRRVPGRAGEDRIGGERRDNRGAAGTPHHAGDLRGPDGESRGSSGAGRVAPSGRGAPLRRGEAGAGPLRPRPRRG